MAYDDDAFSRALLMAGLGMMGRGNTWDKIAQGGMFGLQGYDQALNDKERRKLMAAKLRDEELQAKAREVAIARQAKLAEILNGGGAAQVPPAGSRPAMADAPGWRPQVKAPAVDQDEAMIRMLMRSGFTKEAEDALKVYKGLEGEVYGDPQMDRDGKVFVNTKRGPRYVDGGFVPRDKLVEVDLGGEKAFRGEYDTNLRGRVLKTMSGAEKDASARGWANLDLSRQQFNRGELREVPTAEGTQRMAWVTPQGANFVPGTGEKRERLHDSAAEKLLTLDTMMQSASVALREMEANPGSGPGPVIGRIPDVMANYFDPKGLKSRQFLSDLTTQITLARSGAAVTEQEYKRLEPFLAKPTDTEEIAKEKVRNLMEEYGKIRAARASFYTAQGYKVPAPDMGLPAPNQAKGQIIRQPSIAELEAERMRRNEGR